MHYKSKYPIVWTVAQLIINKLEYQEAKNDSGFKSIHPMDVHVKMNVNLPAMK